MRARLIAADELALFAAKVELLVRVDAGPGEGWVRRLAVVRQVKESVLRVHMEHRTGPAERGAATVRDPKNKCEILLIETGCQTAVSGDR